MSSVSWYNFNAFLLFVLVMNQREFETNQSILDELGYNIEKKIHQIFQAWGWGNEPAVHPKEAPTLWGWCDA